MFGFHKQQHGILSFSTSHSQVKAIIDCSRGSNLTQVDKIFRRVGGQIVQTLKEN